MKKLRFLALLLAGSLFLVNLSSIPVKAGKEIQTTELTMEDGLNVTDWNFVDSNIVNEGGKVVIPAETSTAETRFISKNVSKVNASVNEITSVDAVMRLTALPEGQLLALAFGLSSIEAYLGEVGNVELHFTNQGGIKLGITAYTDAGAATVLEPQSCGLSLDRDFTIRAAITPEAVLTVMINGKEICRQSIPVNGAGRFGVLQSGSCGAAFASLNYGCKYYNTPENMDIFEDFESNAFNANLLCSASTPNGICPSGVKIADFDGNKALFFQNTNRSYFGTLYKYSNFEVSFDIPYFLRETIYDEYGEVMGKPCTYIGLSWGEETPAPTGHSYVTAVDLIAFRSDTTRSEVKKVWSEVSFADLGVTDTTTNEGYSVKLSVIDGNMELGIKSLTATEYITIATADYDTHKSGYIYVWSTGGTNAAIDNFKLVNKDENPNLIDVEYQSSLITAEDYVPTEEEMKLVFREENTAETDQNGFEGKIFVVCCTAGAALLVITGVVVYFVMKRKKQGEGEKKDEAN